MPPKRARTTVEKTVTTTTTTVTTVVKAKKAAAPKPVKAPKPAKTVKTVRNKPSALVPQLPPPPYHVVVVPIPSDPDRCQGTLKQGKFKGLQCSHKIAPGNKKFCDKHKKKTKKPKVSNDIGNPELSFF